MLTNEYRLKIIEAVEAIRSQCDLFLLALKVPGGPGMQIEEMETELCELRRRLYAVKDFVLSALGGPSRD